MGRRSRPLSTVDPSRLAPAITALLFDSASGTSTHGGSSQQTCFHAWIAWIAAPKSSGRRNTGVATLGLFSAHVTRGLRLRGALLESRAVLARIGRDATMMRPCCVLD